MSNKHIKQNKCYTSSCKPCKPVQCYVPVQCKPSCPPAAVCGYTAKPSSHCSKPTCVTLTQEDFDEGTYRITESGYYRLGEDIVFNPNPDNLWLPTEDQEEYSGEQYQWGFFAALTIETSHVTLDLCGHSISQSEVHAAVMRNFSVIVLGDSPNIAGEGACPCPPNPCCPDGIARNVTIKCGTIGRSAKNGILGNGNSCILMKDLTIKEFEHSGISVNGFKDVYVECSKIGPTYQDVKVNYMMNSLRNMQIFLSSWIDENDTALQAILTGGPVTGASAYVDLVALQSAIDATILSITDDIEAGDPVSNATYTNGSNGLPTGNAYGIHSHSHGLLINECCECCPEIQIYSCDLKLRNVCIEDITASPYEAVGLTSTDGEGVISLPDGSLFPVLFTTDNEQDDTAAEFSVVTDLYRSFSIIAYSLVQDATLVAGETVSNADFSTWAVESSGEVLSDYFDAASAKYVFNKTIDNTLLKGVHGLAVFNTKNTSLDKLNIKDVHNEGSLGSEVAPYKFSPESGDAPQGYRGGLVSGLTGSGVHGFCGSCVEVYNVTSAAGSAYGYRWMNASSGVALPNARSLLIQGGEQQAVGDLIVWRAREWNVGTLAAFEAAALVALGADLPNIVPSAFGAGLVKLADDECDSKVSMKCLIVDTVRAPAAMLEYGWQIYNLSS